MNRCHQPLEMGSNMRAAVVLILLVALPAFGQNHAAASSEPRVETGALDGAAFRIDLPAQWNRGLVMYCHGYLHADTMPNLNA